MGWRRRLWETARAVGAIGDRPDDDGEARLRHRLLVWMGLGMSGGGLVWGTLTLGAFRHPAAAVPFAYVVATVANLAWFRHTRRFVRAREIQVLLGLLLPLLFQLSLGGVAASGGVMWWSVLALTASLTFAELRDTLRWTAWLLVGIGLVGALDPVARTWAVPASDAWRVGFAVLNVALVTTLLVGLTAYHLFLRHADNAELAAANQRISELATGLSDQVQRATLAERQAHAANIAKSTFLANMSHELRTPLNAILGYAELLAEEDPDRGAAELGHIRTAGLHLLSTLSDILDLAKIEAGKVTVDPGRCDCGALAREVVDTLAPLIARNRNTATVDAGAALAWTDASKVRQILFNLVGNAAKFTRDGRISVSVAVIDQVLHLSVVDTGVGMTDDQLRRVGRPFEQADASTTRQFGGTGLGLHLVSEYAALLGGGLALRSAPGKGTTAEVRLPVRLPETPPGG